MNPTSLPGLLQIGQLLNRCLYVATWLYSTCCTGATVLEEIEFSPLSAGRMEIRMRFSAPPPRPVGYITLQPPRVVLDLPDVTSGLNSRHYSLSNSTRLTLVETPELVRLIVSTPEPVDHSTSIVDRTLFLLLNGPGSAGWQDLPKDQAGSSPESGFTEEGISLNFQDIEVRSALQLLADFTGLDLVVSDEVTGNITLQLNDLPWNQALDIILLTRGLGKRQKGRVLIVAPAEELAEQDRLDLLNRQQLAELAPLITEFIEVNYASASELTRLFESTDDKHAGVISPRGRVLVDQRTNAIILTDTEENIAAFQAVVKKLDVPVRQVLIEARIVSASNNVGERLGVSWGGYSRKLREGLGTFVSGSRATLQQLAQPASETDGDEDAASVPARDDQLIVDLGIDSSDATSFAIGLLTDSSLLELEINALASQGKAEVIARPKLITSDKTEARIASGLQIPFEQSAAHGATSISFKEATLSLQVTPQITPDDRIIMQLNISQDTLGVNTAAGPAINTNQISTQVQVEDGETIVLGGVFTTNRTEDVAKTPLLGDLPLLGRLFSRTSRTDNKEELLIFITPSLIRDSVAHP